jgi:hypothetical protein
MVSEFAISYTYRHDTGLLSCHASNTYGQDEMIIQLIVQGTATSYLTSSYKVYLLNVAPSEVEWSATCLQRSPTYPLNKRLERTFWTRKISFPMAVPPQFRL